MLKKEVLLHSHVGSINDVCACLEPGSWILCLSVRPPVSSINCTKIHAYDNEMFILIFIKFLNLILLQRMVLNTKIWPKLERCLYLWYLQYQWFSMDISDALTCFLTTLKKITLVKSGSALKSESIYQQNCLTCLGG